ncbi:MAG: hypothetical protein DHS20C09_02610 [marine bacterium B5-7]|nr:MAG: hypothetical protein DHS20C09_02610 [marine bacterium B5-7]
MKFKILNSITYLFLFSFVSLPLDADTLYTELGGSEAVTKFVTKAVETLHADQRVAFLFEDTDEEETIIQISDLICFLSSGPCEYDGQDMDEVHSGMEITEAEFDIFVSIVIDAMEFADIAHSTRNKLLALLAPMREEIINQ